MRSTGHLSVIGVGFAAEQSVHMVVVAQSIVIEIVVGVGVVVVVVVVVEVDGVRRRGADVDGGEKGDLSDMRMRVRIRVRVIMVRKGMGMRTGPVM